MHPTPNEIQVAAAELDRLIFKNQKQEKKYIYRRQCPVTNGNRSSGEAEEKEGVAGGGELINYLHLLRDQRVGSAGRTAAIPLPWLPRRCRDFCELRGAPIPVSQYNRTQLSTADVEEIEVIGIEGARNRMDRGLQFSMRTKLEREATARSQTKERSVLCETSSHTQPKRETDTNQGLEASRHNSNIER